MMWWQQEFIIANRVFLIAEAGVNHNGDLRLAKELIDVSVKAGADAVKFQTFTADELILPGVEKAPYQMKTSDADESQTDMLKRLEIDLAFHEALIAHCEQKGIMFLSTPYGEKSLALLMDLDLPMIKIASTDTTNLLFLEKVATAGKPVILSTGMSTIAEIQDAYTCLRKNGCKDLSLLKCTSNYPTDIREVNLNSMLTLANAFDAVIGFSDHTEGVGASPYAVAMGARIVEKHFTLDKNMEGPDHKASLSPVELLEWVAEIRKIETLLGTKMLGPTKSEQQTKISLQKSLVTKRDLKAGEELTRDNLMAKRTGGVGIKVSQVYNILGSKVQNDIRANVPITYAHLDE